MSRNPTKLRHLFMKDTFWERNEKKSSRILYIWKQFDGESTYGTLRLVRQKHRSKGHMPKRSWFHYMTGTKKHRHETEPFCEPPLDWVWIKLTLHELELPANLVLRTVPIFIFKSSELIDKCQCRGTAAPYKQLQFYPFKASVMTISTKNLFLLKKGEKDSLEAFTLNFNKNQQMMAAFQANFAEKSNFEKRYNLQLAIKPVVSKKNIC